MVLFRFNQLRKVVEKIIAKYISDTYQWKDKNIKQKSLILDPTTRFKNCKDQPKLVNEEKQNIYNKKSEIII